MKKLFLPMAVITAIIITSCGGGEENTETTTNTGDICFYSYDEAAGTQVRWTAFKTSDKIAVGGQFNEVNVTAGDKSTKITDVLQTIKFNIPTASTNTANAERDDKIIASFFGAMTATDLIIGQVKSATGDNTSGSCVFYLTLNDVEREVTLNYTVDDATIKLTGAIDINNWNGQTALAALNEACSEPHKGEGTESISWPNVELAIETTLKKACH